MKENLLNHQFVLTDDGSQTLFSKKYQENCHSTHGAIMETRFQYIEGCKVLEKLEEQNINILEIGLGAGIGVFTTIQEITKNYQGANKATIISLEEDLELIELFESNLFAKFPEFSKEAKNQYINQKQNLRIIILYGNARDSIFNIGQILPGQKINCIYQDAFSPKKNPILWTIEWFKDLKNISSNNCILSTYSSSLSIRKSLVLAGWFLENGGSFGPKRSSTRANLLNKYDESIHLALLSKKIIPLTDNLL